MITATSATGTLKSPIGARNQPQGMSQTPKQDPTTTTEARKEVENSTSDPNQSSGAPATSKDSEDPTNSGKSNSADLKDNDDSKGSDCLNHSSVLHQSDCDSSVNSNPSLSELPGLEEDSSMCSTHGRFRDSQSESQESTTLPQRSEWRTIKDPRRRRHLEYVLSHPNKKVSADAWRWTLKPFGPPSPGCYSSDKAEFFYECFKTRNNRSSACSAAQGD